MSTTNSEEHKKHRREYFRRWRMENPEKSREYTKRYRDKNWRKNNGLPEPTRPQPDACECCGRKQKISLSLDHCHETGVFRGWLCHSCNMSIGALGDDVAGLMRAVSYLQNAGSK